MATMLSLVAAALAYKPPCAQWQPVGSVPAIGAVDVPVDVQPAFVFGQDDCDDNAFTIRLEDDTNVLVTSVEMAEVVDSFVELPVAEPVEGGVAHSLYIYSDDDAGASSWVGFTTGTELASPVGAPASEHLRANWNDDVLSVSVEVTPSGDDEAIVQIVDPANGTSTHMAEEGEANLLSREIADAEPPEEVCVTVRQRGFGGDWADAEELCATVTHCGCSAGPATVRWALWVPLLALARRRR